jgi:hypothetical protein
MTVYHQNSALGQFTTYLESTICRCRSDKQRGRPLCYDCFKVLDNKLADRLKFARGDEARMEAFDDAKDWLEENGL